MSKSCPAGRARSRFPVLARMKRNLATYGAAALCMGFATAASSQALDFELRYDARTTLHYPHKDSSDNDIFGLSTGLTTDLVNGGLRWEFFLGLRNEYFGDDYPTLAGLEAVRFHDDPDRWQWGYGARADWASDHTTTGELAVAARRFVAARAYRGTIGVQTSAEEIYGRDDLTGAFAVGEYSWYARDGLVIRAGVQADRDGTLAAGVAEFRFGRSPVSFELTWAYTLDSYRDIGDYNDLTYLIRFSPGYKTFRDRDRARPSRLLHRYAAVQ